MKPFWSMHTHSKFSVGDALSDVREMVDVAVDLGYPALGLTDHGSISGSVQLYKACRAKDVKPLPGVELYVTMDRENRVQGNNQHLTVVSTSEKGYRNLCRMITMTSERMYYKPRLDFADFAEMCEDGITDGLAIATGCWFGVLPTTMRHQGPEAALHLAKTLAGWFDQTFVELQAHGIEQVMTEADIAAKAERVLSGQEKLIGFPMGKKADPDEVRPRLLDWLTKEHSYSEDEMVAALIELAGKAGLPYVITSDAHYVHSNEQPLHDALKKMLSFDATNLDDAVFPGDPYSLPGNQRLKQYFEPGVLATAIDNLHQLAESSSVTIPELDTFRALVPDVTAGGDPDAQLRQRVAAAMLNKLPETFSAAKRKRYTAQALEELDVMVAVGAAGYILLVDDICAWMREQGILFNARGSANGSLVCWLLGITGIDSIHYGLRFERFMSRDRTTLPDVDLDIEDARREEVAEELSKRFVTARVGSLSTWSMHGENDPDGDGSGSLFVKYKKAANANGGKIQKWEDVPPDDRRALYKLSERKLVGGFGTHAAGWIVAPDSAALADMPLATVGGKLVSAYDKNDVEELGFVKVDLLSVRQLTAARICCEAVGITLEEIPDKDPDTFKRLWSGNTVSLFQLQGATNTRGMRDMHPTKLADIIAAQALFRPGVRSMQESFLARRIGDEIIPEMHPDLMAETKKTYGIFLYQEQVIGALRTIGMGMARLNKLLKAVKASNGYVAAARAAIGEALPEIRELGGARGWSESDIEILVNAVSGYADYGFNEAHAVAYGLFAWRTAYLATHYPLEWWTGTLYAFAEEKQEKVNRLLQGARRDRVRLLPVHVNESRAKYRLDREQHAIRKGLIEVRGVGPTVAAEIVRHQPYTSLRDFGQRVTSAVSGARPLAFKKPLEECTGVTAVLAELGAFEGLPVE